MAKLLTGIYMVTVKIKEKGVYMAVNGVEQAIEVGTVLRLDSEPLFAVNKYEVLSDDSEKDLIVGDDDLAELRAEYKSKSGKDAAKSWKLDRLTIEINALDEKAAADKLAADSSAGTGA